MSIQVSYLGVFLAAVSSMAVGAIWYSQGVFGTTWAKLAKVKMNRKPTANEMMPLMGLTFLASLITAYVLAHMIFLSHFFFRNSWLADSVATAVWVWLGFTAVRFFTHDIFEGRRKKLTLLNIGNELVTIVVMGIVLGAVHP